jgi:hypothetical protein
MVKLQDRQACCEEILGPIEWKGQEGVLEECPGGELHSTPFQLGHCVVYLDNYPTVHCFHQSCKEACVEATGEIRQAIRGLYIDDKQEVPWRRRKPVLGTARVVNMGDAAILAEEKRRSLPEIIRTYAWHPTDAYLEAKPRLLPADDHWKQHLSLFDPTDLVWIGNEFNSGPRHGHHFRLVREWMSLERQPYGNFICPSVFKKTFSRGRVVEKSISRKNENVERRRCLVLESDTLSRPDSCAVYNWCRSFMRLRALIHSGKKSIHAWFDFPGQAMFELFRVIAPGLQMDMQVFNTASQPVRIAGAYRKDTGRWQHLIWFDKPNDFWNDKAPFVQSNGPN